MHTVSSTLVAEEHVRPTLVLSPSKKQEGAAVHSVWGTSIRFTIVTAILFGLAYPLFITGLAHVLFPRQASGSLILHNGQVIGSELIAQSFTSDKYFHPRPSDAGNGYDATSSGGSNLAQSNAKLAQRSRATSTSSPRRIPASRFPSIWSPPRPPVSTRTSLPTTLTTRRRAWPRPAGLSEDAVHKLIAEHTEHRDLGFLGEQRVNVLELNLALDQLSK